MSLQDDELLKVLVLVEDSNIKYANLKDEFHRRGVDSMDLKDCEDYMNTTLAPEYTKKILRVLNRRRYIQIVSYKVILSKDKFVNQGRHLDDADKEFASSLLSDAHEYEKI